MSHYASSIPEHHSPHTHMPRTYNHRFLTSLHPVHPDEYLLFVILSMGMDRFMSFIPPKSSRVSTVKVLFLTFPISIFFYFIITILLRQYLLKRSIKSIILGFVPDYVEKINKNSAYLIDPWVIYDNHTNVLFRLANEIIAPQLIKSS
jgi:hypothetical protein